MCGRAAQTSRALKLAEDLLLGGQPNINETVKTDVDRDDSLECSNTTNHYDNTKEKDPIFCDNFNLSPGQSSIIFCQSTVSNTEKKLKRVDDTSFTTTAKHENDDCPPSSSSSGLKICKKVKVWGIIPRSGTKNNPLPDGPGKHFSSLMYNARSDTLYDKRTFHDLAVRGNTCIWAITGFYEWKQPQGNALSKIDGGARKQPYFVHRRDGLPLLIPGLWKRVQTGRRKNSPQVASRNQTYMHGKNGSESTDECRDVDYDANDDDVEYLDTFTHLTTDACSSLKWLHHRQPVFIWDVKLATEWIQNPSKELVKKMSAIASGTDSDIKVDGNSAMGGNANNILGWHPVTKKMSNVKYKHSDCVDPIKIETVPSVKSFFSLDVARSKYSVNKSKRKKEGQFISSSPSKKTKKQRQVKSIADLIAAGGNGRDKTNGETNAMEQPNNPSILGVNEYASNQDFTNLKSQNIRKDKLGRRGTITNFFRPKKH